MDQRTHSWIAIRAVALLDSTGKDENLVKLLKPALKNASVGAWLPDTADSRRGSGSVDNHVLKLEPYTGSGPERFITSKKELLKRIGTHRLTAQFISQDTSLDDSWWKTPFKGDVKRPGQHIPNRISAMVIMLCDLLVMGNKTVDNLIPGDIGCTKYLDPHMCTHEEAAAMYFFMISHFIADISMPCHCDGRILSSYNLKINSKPKTGLHKDIEDYWSRIVGPNFEKDKLIDFSKQDEKNDSSGSDTILKKAIEVDKKFDLNFQLETIPGLMPKQDAWLEAINLCRASFAISSIMLPPNEYKYDNSNSTDIFENLFDKVFSTNQKLLTEITKVALYDAVLNTAIFWKQIWKKVAKV